MPTIAELGARYRSGETTPTQVVESYLQRIETLDPQEIGRASCRERV